MTNREKPPSLIGDGTGDESGFKWVRSAGEATRVMTGGKSYAATQSLGVTGLIALSFTPNVGHYQTVPVAFPISQEVFEEFDEDTALESDLLSEVVSDRTALLKRELTFSRGLTREEESRLKLLDDRLTLLMAPLAISEIDEAEKLIHDLEQRKSRLEAIRQRHKL